MNKKIILLLAFFTMLICKSNFAQSTDPYAATVAEIYKEYKEKDKVVEGVLTFDKDSINVSADFYLPKGKYVVFVIPDTGTIKVVQFSMSWELGEGDTKEKSNRSIVAYGNKTIFGRNKKVISNPISVSNGFGILDFKIDNVMNLANNMTKKSSAQYAANSSGMKQTWNKTSNGAMSIITITTSKDDKKGDYNGSVKVLVFKR